MYITIPGVGGSYEIFHTNDYDQGLSAPGWYWWACWPGCLPDSDPVGPFDTEELAKQDVMTFWADA